MGEDTPDPAHRDVVAPDANGSREDLHAGDETACHLAHHVVAILEGGVLFDVAAEEAAPGPWGEMGPQIEQIEEFLALARTKRADGEIGQRLLQLLRLPRSILAPWPTPARSTSPPSITS